MTTGMVPRPARTARDLLADARSHLRRLTPFEAHAAAADGDRLVDIRSERERAVEGVIPFAYFIPRNLLEWKLDPHSPRRDHAVTEGAPRLILFCQDGFQSSLAAATVQQFGIEATDIIDGFAAWRSAGLPVVAAAANSPRATP